MRLIDADALYRSLSDWQLGSFATVGHETEYNLLDKVLTGVGAAPTIDAIPVVRCRECIHWNKGTNDAESWEYCTLLKHNMGGDMFCSHGERKIEPPRCKTCKARCVYAGRCETSVHGKCLVGYVPITNADVVRSMVLQ